jgi:hypothetical protein
MAGAVACTPDSQTAAWNARRLRPSPGPVAERPKISARTWMVFREVGGSNPFASIGRENVEEDDLLSLWAAAGWMTRPRTQQAQGANAAAVGVAAALGTPLGVAEGCAVVAGLARPLVAQFP